MRRLFVALLVTAIAFVACAGPVATSPSPTASAQATPKPPKDKVTLTGINSTELNHDKDVELVSLGGDNAVFYTALQSGRVDAIVSFEPIAERVIADNVGYFLLDIYASGQHRDQIGSDKAAALHLVTREDVLATKPDLVKRMVNVQKKGLDFIRGNSASAIADLIMGNTTSAAQFHGLDRS